MCCKNTTNKTTSYIPKTDFNFQIIYRNDLYVMWGKINPRNCHLGKNFGKQFYGMTIIAGVIASIHTLNYWTPELIDVIIVEGLKYFNESVQSITFNDYEVDIDDMSPSCKINDIGASIKIKPFENGTLFSRKNSLARTILRFFQSGNTCGVIQCNMHVITFGVDKEFGYYIFDGQTCGFPLFETDDCGCGYVLRCMSLRRLLFCMISIFNRAVNPLTDEQCEYTSYAFEYKIKVSNISTRHYEDEVVEEPPVAQVTKDRSWWCNIL